MTDIPEEQAPRILQLFSNRANSELLAEFFSKQNLTVFFEVEEVDNARIDLCLVDGPELSQRPELLKKLREQATPILFFTPTSEVNKFAPQLNKLVDEIVQMPVTRAELNFRINSMLRLRQLSLQKETLYFKSLEDIQALKDERDLRERFVAMLSHDLRTPLTAALLTTQFLNRVDTASPLVQNFGPKIVRNIERMDGMINNLLDANRLKAGERLPLVIERSDLREIVELAIAGLDTVHGQRFAILGDRSLEGFWDRSALRRIIENLCSNAIKYGFDSSIVAITLSHHDGWARIAVHNEGPVIAQQDQAKLFDAFQRTESAQTGGKAGWGLGLTLVRGVAEAHGGRAEVHSEAGKGTTFNVMLPIENEALRSDRSF